MRCGDTGANATAGANKYIMITHFIALSSFGATYMCHFVFAQDDRKPCDCLDLKCHGLSKATDGPHIIYTGMADLSDTCLCIGGLIVDV